MSEIEIFKTFVREAKHLKDFLLMHHLWRDSFPTNI